MFPFLQLRGLALTCASLFALVVVAACSGDVVSIDQPDRLPMAELINDPDRQREPLVPLEWELVGTWELVEQEPGTQPALGDAIDARCAFQSDMTMACTTSQGEEMGVGLWIIDQDWGEGTSAGVMAWSRLPRVGRSEITLRGDQLMLEGGVWERQGDLPRSSAPPSMGERPDHATALDGTWRVAQSEIARVAVGDLCTLSADQDFDCRSAESPWSGTWTVGRFDSFGLRLVMVPHTFEVGFVQADAATMTLSLDGQTALLERE